jgi:hypothetical protein
MGKCNPFDAMNDVDDILRIMMTHVGTITERLDYALEGFQASKLFDDVNDCNFESHLDSLFDDLIKYKTNPSVNKAQVILEKFITLSDDLERYIST